MCKTSVTALFINVLKWQFQILVVIIKQFGSMNPIYN